MLDRSVLRWGGLIGVVGSALGLVFNLLHPRSSGAPGDVEQELELVAGSDIWLFDHYMLTWSIAAALIALVAIGWSFENPRSQGWARFAIASAIGGVAVAFMTLLVDGFAMSRVAEDWAANPNDTTLATATAVVQVGLALFTGIIGSLFGLTPVLYGVTVLAGDEHPGWLGWLALGAGALGLLTASMQYLGGPSNLTANVLFPVASLGFTVWIAIMSWKLWKAPVGASAPATAAGVRA